MYKKDEVVIVKIIFF